MRVLIANTAVWRLKISEWLGYPWLDVNLKAGDRITHKNYHVLLSQLSQEERELFEHASADLPNGRRGSNRAVDYTWPGGDKVRYFGVRFPCWLIEEVILRRGDKINALLCSGNLDQNEKFLREHLKPTGVPV